MPYKCHIFEGVCHISRRLIWQPWEMPIIHPEKFRLIPTIKMPVMFVEVNFGNCPVAKPFKSDIKKCSGLLIDGWTDGHGVGDALHYITC